MPEAATVWMVRLDRGRAHEDVRGTLELGDDALVFVEAGSGTPIRFPYGTVRKPSRVRGSPILMLAHESEGELRRVAFYFSQPPPLRQPEPGTTSLPSAGLTQRPMGAFGAFRRSSRRRHMRSNLGYLTTVNVDHKEAIQAWVAEIGERLKAG